MGRHRELWVDAWGESVHSPLVRDTPGRFDVGWRAVLAELELGVKLPAAADTLEVPGRALRPEER